MTNNHLREFTRGWDNHPLSTERNRSPNQLWVLGQIDYHVSQDPFELDDLYGIYIESPLPKRETDPIEPVAVPPILTSIERSHLLETLNANGDSVMFGIENYIQAFNNVVRIISQRQLVILILPCMQTFPNRKCGKNRFGSNLENLKKMPVF